MRRSSRFLPLVLVLALPTSAQAAAVVAPAEHERAGGKPYWTDARMKAAKPREMAKPGGGGGGGGGGTGGFSSTSFEPATYPVQHGKVFFTDNGANYVCSGTAVKKGAVAIVWTAGHCVWKDSGGAVSNFSFFPRYKNGPGPDGEFRAQSLYTTQSWAASRQFGTDSGAAVVGTNANGASLASVTAGGRDILINADRKLDVDVFGYPAAGKFNGRTMRQCHTRWLRDDTSTNPDAIGVGCDQTGGSSGGGWISSTGLLVSNVSYGYQSLKNVLFGPHLEAEAQALYNAAG